MNQLLVSELTWPQQVALNDYTLFTQRLPIEGSAKAEHWLERKRKDFLACIMHINEQASYTAFLARLIKETPSPAARAAELASRQ
ncbi:MULTISPECIES: hypothetical protein [Pseudomonas]|jgi:hypothetical protein|uniref:Uncharacterized protein n=1 Tax=Pseudomonas putida TaxID=303 RepID=A0A1L7NNY5_PSEPU|nr:MULTISPECIES: hypothetical protein [Pseudomonas]PYG98566.1 hypothetical protein CVV67_20050 [Arthrobacter stackebrandtii]HCF2574680.1 hypothetical protein [Pseudomonas aeruginosa]AGN82379.1 hypothetical protein L483_15670 [Pseudomonas putida H8234]KYC18833.1 hypothetical protein WM94_19100 [Pseudomonas sp. ABFPK]MBA1319805.1 hypothetical protein [Pseudomonas monteilii]